MVQYKDSLAPRKLLTTEKKVLEDEKQSILDDDKLLIYDDCKHN